MKKYGVPFLVIILGSLLLYLFRVYTYFAFKGTFMTILTAFILFMYGIYLNGYKGRRKDTWVKKFIVTGCFIVLMMIQFGYLRFGLVNVVLDFIGGSASVIFYMLYIYCGYVFF